MQVVTMPTDPKLAMAGTAQKIIVLKRQSDVKDPLEEAKLICEKNKQTLEAKKKELLLKPNDL